MERCMSINTLSWVWVRDSDIAAVIQLVMGELMTSSMQSVSSGIAMRPSQAIPGRPSTMLNRTRLLVSSTIPFKLS